MGLKKSLHKKQHKNKLETDSHQGALSWPAYVKIPPLQTWELAKRVFWWAILFSQEGGAEDSLHFSAYEPVFECLWNLQVHRVLLVFDKNLSCGFVDQK